MTSRERIVLAINHKEPDRVPIAFGGCHDSIHVLGHRKLKEYLNLEGGLEVIQDPFQQIVFPDSRLLERFSSDTLAIYANPPDGFVMEYKEEGENLTYTDEWGTKYRQPKAGGLYYDFAHQILAGKTIDEVKAFPFPDPTDPGRFRGLRRRVEQLHSDTDKAIIAYSPTPGIFESTFWLRSFEETYIDMASNVELIEALTGRLLDWMLQFWEAYLKEIGDLVQVVQIGDDLGGQTGPLFSPKLYRNVYKPKHQELISLIKKHTSAKVYFHSCGSIYEYLPDLIEVGVEILNPVQVSARNMDSAKLKKEFGNDLVFWGGGCDPHSTLSKGSPNDVKEDVRRRISDLGPGGGYVFASIHNIQCDVPPENVIAFFDAAREYGKNA
jgi:uroporphyrinogen decarboxylase